MYNENDESKGAITMRAPSGGTNIFNSIRNQEDTEFEFGGEPLPKHNSVSVQLQPMIRGSKPSEEAPDHAQNFSRAMFRT